MVERNKEVRSRIEVGYSSPSINVPDVFVFGGVWTAYVMISIGRGVLMREDNASAVQLMLKNDNPRYTLSIEKIELLPGEARTGRGEPSTMNTEVKHCRPDVSWRVGNDQFLS